MSNEKKDREWTVRVGTIKAGSIEPIEGKDAVRAIVVNAEGKEHIIEGYGERQVARINEAAASDKEMVFKGPFYTKDGVSHLMVNYAHPKGEPKPKAEPKAKPEPTEAEKAEAEAKAEQRAEANRERAAIRDASRVMVEAGTVAVGASVEKDGVTHEVNHVGATFESDGKAMAYAYFGDLGAEMAARAAAAEPKAEEPEAETAGMEP